KGFRVEVKDCVGALVGHLQPRIEVVLTEEITASMDANNRGSGQKAVENQAGHRLDGLATAEQVEIPPAVCAGPLEPGFFGGLVAAPLGVGAVGDFPRLAVGGGAAIPSERAAVSGRQGEGGDVGRQLCIALAELQQLAGLPSV